MNTIFGLRGFHWARMALLASAATTCVCGSAVAQSLAGAPLPDPAASQIEADSSLELAPGEMLLNPETIPPELRPKFPENAPHASVMEGHGHPHAAMPLHGDDLGGWSTSCGGCEPGYIGRFDALYMTNDSADGVTLSNDFRLGDFDYEWGGRAMLRRQFDCVNGYELVGTVMPEWEQTRRTVLAPIGTFDSFLEPVAPLVAADIDTFNDDGNQHTQRYRAEYYSIEANRTYNGWDVANLLFGVRAIDYQEEYRYDTVDPDGAGLYRQETENILVGVQAGLDLYYPISQRLWSSLRGRGGIFANFADGDTLLQNDGTDIANNSADDEDISGILEVGAGLRYNVGPALSLHGGYEVWYLHDVATASDQLDGNISAQLGNRLRIDDDVMIHGLNVGAELRF